MRWVTDHTEHSCGRWQDACVAGLLEYQEGQRKRAAGMVAIDPDSMPDGCNVRPHEGVRQNGWIDGPPLDLGGSSNRPAAPLRGRDAARGALPHAFPPLPTPHVDEVGMRARAAARQTPPDADLAATTSVPTSQPQAAAPTPTSRPEAATAAQQGDAAHDARGTADSSQKQEQQQQHDDAERLPQERLAWRQPTLDSQRPHNARAAAHGLGMQHAAAAAAGGYSAIQPATADQPGDRRTKQVSNSSLGYGQGPNNSPGYGQGPNNNPGYGQGPKSTGYGQGPNNNAGYGQGPNNSPGYGQGRGEGGRLAAAGLAPLNWQQQQQQQRVSHPPPTATPMQQYQRAPPLDSSCGWDKGHQSLPRNSTSLSKVRLSLGSVGGCRGG